MWIYLKGVVRGRIIIFPKKMMEKKILFLTDLKNDYFSKEMKNIDVQQHYRYINKLFKIIRRIHYKLKLPLFSLWMENWKKHINNYDIVIIRASILTPPIVKYINNANSSIRVIVWFSNPVSQNYRVEPYKNLKCELWSFDKDNCIKYNLKYNTQFYFSSIKLPKNDILYDVFFVGANKGRLNKLLEIENNLKTKGLRTYFHITATKLERNPIYKKRIPYKSILDYISKSNVILDINQENQSGLTLRPLEALFFSKKLITNNKNIIHYDFYNKNNIFILGLDDPDEIIDFIKSPYKKINEEIVQRYDFNNWIKRFIYEK